MLPDFFGVIHVADTMRVHPSMTETTGRQGVVVKRVEVLCELKVAVGTRDGLIGVYSKRQEHCTDDTKREEGYKNRCHTHLPLAVFLIRTETTRRQEELRMLQFTQNVDISSSR